MGHINQGTPLVWDEFIKNGRIQSQELDPIITRSWERSYNYQVDPFNSSNSILEGNYLRERMDQWGEMLDAAAPFMEDLYIGIKGLDNTVILTDNQGYILHSLGDPSFVQKAQQVWLSTGANWREEFKGTNAIGTALHEQKAVNVFAWEHFCQENHFLACSAVPIFNHKQELLGVLDVTGDYQGADVRLLNLVKVAVNGIQREMMVRHLSGELKLSREKSSALGEAYTQGFVAFDGYGRISEINPKASQFLGLGVQECVGKPLAEVVHRRGHHVVVPNQERPQKAGLRYSFNSILGHSSAIKNTKAKAERAALGNSTVLLWGESGTGKELFAQAIHQASGRNGNFIALNCAAIPDELIESELFGYEAGAFTGAKQKGSAGKFEMANGGTIFLDEIGDMPYNLQVSLLRVLQEKCVTRVGGQKVIPVDVRVIAATHQNLIQKVREGKFRQDLFYRLNVITLEIPSLRERREDIIYLANHFLEKYKLEANRPGIIFSSGVLDCIANYSWPGNIRELENLIEGLVNTVEQQAISLSHLPSVFRENNTLNGQAGEEAGNREHWANPSQAVLAAKSFNSITSFTQDDDASLRDIEAIAIKETIRRCDNNMTKAAKSLGIGRTTLYRKMKEYNIF